MTNLPALPKTDPANPIAPRNVEEAVTQSLKHVLGCSPNFHMTTMFPANEPSYQVVTGLDFGGRGAEQFDADALRKALAVVDDSSRPASPSDLAKAVAYMSVRCKRRDTSESDTNLAVRVMIQDLSELPADVALWSLDEWSRKSPWWPTRAEILDLAKRHRSKRQWLKNKLERALFDIERDAA